MKRKDVDNFEKLVAQLDGLYQEIAVLAKKSPHDAINEFKLQFINKALDNCNKFLGESYRPFGAFEVFLTDDMPTNSDVTFILSQYIECAEKFRADNINNVYQDWYWEVDDLEPDEAKDRLQTRPPKKLMRK